VKYGKLGGEFTFCGNPFKKPLVMIKTGSVFKTEKLPKEFYGRMIKEIAPAKPKEVVQYGYAFAVPIIVNF
jgi:CRISPR-associated protein Csm4